MKLQKIEKRVFKAPEFLKYEHKDYDTYELHYEYEVEREIVETKDKHREIRTNDVYYRKADSPKSAEWTYGYSFRNIYTNQKYVCFGGPLDGTKAILHTTGYIAYNCAENTRWVSKKDKKYMTNILVWKDLVKN